MASLEDIRKRLAKLVPRIAAEPLDFVFVEKASDGRAALLIAAPNQVMAQDEVATLRTGAKSKLLKGTVQKVSGKVRLQVAEGDIAQSAPLALRGLFKAVKLESVLASQALVAAPKGEEIGVEKSDLERWSDDLDAYAKDVTELARQVQTLHRAAILGLSPMGPALDHLRTLVVPLSRDAVDEDALAARYALVDEVEDMVEEGADFNAQLQGLDTGAISEELAAKGVVAVTPVRVLGEVLGRSPLDTSRVANLLAELDDVAELRKRTKAVGRGCDYFIDILAPHEFRSAVDGLPDFAAPTLGRLRTLKASTLSEEGKPRALVPDRLEIAERVLAQLGQQIIERMPRVAPVPTPTRVFHPIDYRTFKSKLKSAGDTDEMMVLLARGELNDRHAKRDIFNKPLHQHAAGGSEGFAFYYKLEVVRGVEEVTPIIYDYATNREGNRYYWNGGQSSGPPKIS